MEEVVDSVESEERDACACGSPINLICTVVCIIMQNTNVVILEVIDMDTCLLMAIVNTPWCSNSYCCGGL